MQIGSANWKRLIIDGAAQMKVDVDSHQADQLAAHAETLALWAQKMNLTTIRDPVEVAVKHYLDSLAPAGLIPENAVLLDVGSGGGFPGIPLKIINPSLSITLIDASRRKVNFLKHMIRTLKLKSIEATHARLERFSPGILFDVIVSRAFSDLSTFARTAAPLLAANGVFIAYKARNVRSDIASFCGPYAENGMSDPDGEDDFLCDVHSYRLPVIDAERSLVIIRRRQQLKAHL
jgi:16S rRNA (guanine527-N7)-methyltransferase